MKPLLASVILITVALTSPLARAAGNIDESKVGSLPLPDVLLSADGKPIRDIAAWRAHRPALLETFAREVYGRTPAARPPSFRWETTSVDRTALGGKATRKELTLHFTARADGPKLHLLIYQPNAGSAPYPAFLGLNFYGNQCVNTDPGITVSTAWMRPKPEYGIVANRATEKTRGAHATGWDVAQVVARGYATVTAYYGDLSPDHPAGFAESVGPLFATGTAEQRAPDSWGALGIWAWGLSRALDVLAADREIDATRVAVHGHSRLGKAALWAAAQDERFALVISNNSGAGGAALAKRNFGETVALINKNFPHWFARNYRAYNAREAALPVDQHQLLALLAPRPVYVASATEDLHADPKGEFLAAQFAEPVYALYGQKGLGVATQPSPDQSVGDTIGYHLRTGPHAITPADWTHYLAFADRHLRKKP